jgi:hypothetical protein
MNPYSYTVGNCSVKTNILNSDSVVNPTIPGYTGSYAGHNGLGIALYADRFIAIDTIKLTALIFNIASLTAAGSNSSLSIHIWKGNNQPETLIYSQNVLYKSLTNTIKNSITLDKVIALKDTFFVGFEISYASTDKFALFIAPDRFSASLNTSYALVGNVWTSFSDIVEYVYLSTSMDIGLQTCDIMTGINSNRTPGDEISIYPNPTTGFFRISSNDPGQTGSVSIYDMRGGLIKYSFKTHSSEGMEINLGEAAPGIYIVRGQSRQGPWTKKLLKF